jgi:hypothetical protein
LVPWWRSTFHQVSHKAVSLSSPEPVYSFDQNEKKTYPALNKSIVRGGVKNREVEGRQGERMDDSHL